jgi:DNA-binding NarL/FixJ family response regulator
MLGSLEDGDAGTGTATRPDDDGLGGALLRAAGDQQRPVTIVIIEDQLLVADGFRIILDAIPGLTVLEVAPTCAEGFAAVSRHCPDVLLLDHWLPDGLGVEQIPALLQICDKMKVLVVTAQNSDQLVVSAFTAGAVGVIVKTKRAADLVTAIRAAARGDAVVTPDVLNQIVRGLSSAEVLQPDRHLP